MTTRARQTKQRLQIERFRLQFGPYAPPKVPRKNLLLCEMRGYLKVSPNWSDGLIPWPRRWRTGSIILCGDLVRAVKMESVEAVCYHWGVCRNVVQNWRHALSVPESNPGTVRLRNQVRGGPNSPVDCGPWCGQSIPRRSFAIHSSVAAEHSSREENRCRHLNFRVVFLASTGQMKAWLKHRKRQNAHRTQRS
jgi:hypothetical protein